MKAFDNKKSAERFIYGVGFQKYLTGGITIVSQAVTIALHPDHAGAESPLTLVTDSGVQLNSTSMTILGQTVAIGQAILVAIKGGLAGVTYVVSFAATLSNGEIVYEDVELHVTEFVPTP